MTMSNVYGRTAPMTAKERETFEASIAVLERRSPQLAENMRQLWQKVVETIGEKL